MTLRVIFCEDKSHSQHWLNASECSHWSKDCPRAKKAKKSSHKFKRSGEPGFAVVAYSCGHDGIYQRYEEIKRYTGGWDPMTNSIWIPASPGLLIACIACGLKGAI